MRIVHIFPTLNPGGAERMLVHVLMHLDRSRFDVSAICLGRSNGSELEGLLAEAQVPVQFLGKGAGFDPRMFTRVHRAVIAARPDVLHSHVHVLRYLFPYIKYSGWLGQRPRMLHTVHNLAAFEVEPRARWIQGLAFRNGVQPVAVAEEVARSVAELYRMDEPVVVPNCVPVDRYSCPQVSREQWRRQEGFGSESILVACVAGLRPQKNHPLLLEGFVSTAARYPQAQLLLAGGGEQRELASLAARLGISERVHFLGVRSDVPDLLAASDLFVLASHYEGNPMSVMEAMAAGLPVVASRVGGVPELVTDGREGLLLSSLDGQSLASALNDLVGDESKRRRMGEASRLRARRSFDVSHMVAGYEALYTSGKPVFSGLLPHEASL